MANETFAEKLNALKKEHGIKITGNRENSKFAVVKKVMQEKNGSKEEAIYKILSELKGKGIEIDDIVFKQVKNLLSNYMTYVRHPEKYKAFEGLQLVDREGQFQVIRKD